MTREIKVDDDDESLLNQLVFGSRQSDPKVLKVLGICGLFNAVGIEQGLETQMAFLAEFLKVDIDDFYEICQRAIERQVLERRGRYVQLKPLPLAQMLAERWLKGLRPKRFFAFVEKLEDLEQNDLRMAFNRRFPLFFDTERAKELVRLSVEGQKEKLREWLKTARGLTILKAFSFVNPSAVTDFLWAELSDWEESDFAKIAGLRDELYRLLQWLCYKTETFERGARLLLRLGATYPHPLDVPREHFTQLFRVGLPGTQAPLKTRSTFLTRLFESERSPNQRALLVRAAGAGFETGILTGSSLGSDHIAVEDYQPKTWAEIFDYRRNLWDLLFAAAKSTDEIETLAREEIVQSVHIDIVRTQLDDLLGALNRFCAMSGPWPQLLEQIQIITGCVAENLRR